MRRPRRVSEIPYPKRPSVRPRAPRGESCRSQSGPPMIRRAAAVRRGLGRPADRTLPSVNSVRPAESPRQTGCDGFARRRARLSLSRWDAEPGDFPVTRMSANDVAGEDRRHWLYASRLLVCGFCLAACVAITGRSASSRPPAAPLQRPQGRHGRSVGAPEDECLHARRALPVDTRGPPSDRLWAHLHARAED